MSWARTVANQWTLLMWKNAILATRRRGLLAMQLLSPIGFVLVLFVVQSFVNQALQSTPAGMEVTSSFVTPIGRIPHCAPPFNSRTDERKCITLAYAPNNSVTDAIMELLKVDQEFGDDDVVGFVSEDELNSFVLANPNITQAGYVFKDITDNFEYSIMLNTTQVCGLSVVLSCKDPYMALAVPMSQAMNRAFFRYQSEIVNNRTLPDFTYEWSVGQLPQPKQILYNASQWIGAIFFFAAIMFNFVILLRTMLQEKELKLKEGMKMMGLLEFSYWTSWFAFYNGVMLCCSFMLILGGWIFQIDLITKNNFWAVFLMLMLFAESMICFAFLLNSVLSHSEQGSTLGFITWIVSSAMITPVNQLLYVTTIPVWARNMLSLLSPLAFSKGLADLAVAGANGGLKWSEIDDYSEAFPISKTYKFLILDSVIYFVLAWYIGNVFPGDFGVPKPFYFFLTPSYWIGGEGKSRNQEYTPLLANSFSSNSSSDVAVELKDLRKTFQVSGGTFEAVKGINLTMKNNQVFCLLGPNGAGKTTTISMMTGLIPCTSGDAMIFGHSIKHNMDMIRSLMGVCPQHDLLWLDMTGREHLTFFCRFKNVHRTDVSEEVESRLKQVGLLSIADAPTKSYSGGEKRRLSVALAMAGDPKIVFLDEPTTGMDPVSQHQVWDIINQAKQGRLVLLTTHSMEEADILSDNIGIVTHGELKCVGTNLSLKNEFGVGYQINLLFKEAVNAQQKSKIQHFCLKSIPDAAINEMSPTLITLNIPRNKSDQLPVFLQELEENSNVLEIHEVAVNLSSLEEVFLKIVSDSKPSGASVSQIIDPPMLTPRTRLLEAQKDVKGTPFFRQFNALFRKVCSSHVMKWRSLIFQFLIPIVMVAVMYASGIQSDQTIIADLHPASLPPLFTRTSPPPLQFPYISYTNNSLGDCCSATRSGFLGNVTLSVLNSSDPMALSLGTQYETNQFFFEEFDDKQKLDKHLYETYNEQWISVFEFNDLDVENFQYRVSLLYGPDEPYAVMGYINIIDNAWWKLISSTNNTLTMRVQEFPTEAGTFSPRPFNVEAAWCLFGPSFYMVVVLSTTVFEKEHRHRYMMKMAGLSMPVYWLVLWITSMAVYITTVYFFIALASIIRIGFFSLNSPAIVLSSFTLFVWVLVGAAFFLSTFCTSSHTASLCSYVFIVGVTLMGTYINPTWAMFGAPDPVLYSTAIVPHIAFGRIVAYVVNQFWPEGAGMEWHEMADRTEIVSMYWFLLVEGLIFYVLHQYFEIVIPTEYGVPRSPFFFLQKSKRGDSEPVLIVNGNEPDDVAAERRLAYKLSDEDHPAKIQGISKVFDKSKKSEKIAVNNVAFSVKLGECFGLIGPNGGGKTTLLNVISGLLPSTSGSASIMGFNICDQLTEAQRFIGVCPQDSILWSELSARQHLTYFARMRNYEGLQLENIVRQSLKEVMLLDAADRPAGSYSGGMKRRLSLAIALIGQPMVVLLDEPTTGVDPFSKRVAWDVIRMHKKNCAIILTTHSMDEAEALCDRVSIMDRGALKCVGSPILLKERYGAHYNLTISHKGPPEEIIKFVTAEWPDAKVLRTLSETIVFSLPKDQVRLSYLFGLIQTKQAELQISDWGLLQTSLVDVLLKVTA